MSGRLMLQCAAISVALTLVVEVRADSMAARYYGQGVHAFNQGDYPTAIAKLDLATNYDAYDPRIYFFRGMAKRRLGWSDDATADLQLGAQLEAVRGRSVGLALQRIQGFERLSVERFRVAARELDPTLLQGLVPTAAPTDQPSVSVPELQPIRRSPSASAPDTANIAPPAATARRVQYVADALPDDGTDPFASDDQGLLLGRGQLQPVAAMTAVDLDADAGGMDPNDDGFAEESFDDEPFGSGVAETDDATDSSDLFAAEDANDLDDSSSSDAPADAPSTASGENKRGVFGAAFRALGRSLTPKMPAASLPIKIPSGSAQSVPEAGTPPADDFGGQGFGDDEMADEDDPFGTNGEEDLGDPFTDDAF